MKIQKVVLGGGIAGLIWAYYNGGVVISPDFGGQMNHHFKLGPRYLEDHPHTRKFLEEMGMPIVERKVKIGFYDAKGIHDEPPSEEYKENYYKKSRGRKDLEGYDATALSSGKTEFVTLDVDFQALIEKLVQELSLRMQLMPGKAIDLDVENGMLTIEDNGNRSMIQFDELVSTMPLNHFCIIAGISMELKCEPITYVLVKMTSAFQSIAQKYDYVYVAEIDAPHHRITLDKEQDQMVLDLFGKHEIVDLQKWYGNFINYHTLWNAQIIPLKDPLVLKRIKFIGRYGTWRREWKTEMVILEAMKAKEQHDLEKSSVAKNI